MCLAVNIIDRFTHNYLSSSNARSGEYLIVGVFLLLRFSYAALALVVMKTNGVEPETARWKLIHNSHSKKMPPYHCQIGFNYLLCCCTLFWEPQIWANWQR